MSVSRKTWLMLSAAVLVSSTAAHAANEAASTGATTDAGNAPAAVTPNPGLQEIIVTAQQRGENVQRAAAPIAVINGASLLNAGISGIETLDKAVPSLAVVASGQGNQIFIRGVGNFSFVASNDPAAAFNYDGVYTGRSTSTYGTFYDLDRVEVLKGPQGTLYGRNATAGAINILPMQPQLGQTSGYASASYGNHKAVQGEGALNLGLGDNAAFRVSGYVSGHDGYLKDGTQDQEDAAVRAQFKVRLTPDLTVRIEGDYAQQRGAGGGASYVGSYAYNPVSGKYAVTPSGFATEQGILTPQEQAYRTRVGTAGRLAGRHLDPLTPGPFQHNDAFGAAIHLDWTTPVGTVSVIPAWRHARKDNLDTESAVDVGDAQDANQYSIEARLVSPTGKLIDYIFGLYYFDEHITDNVHNNGGSLANFNSGQYSTHSPSGYGRLTLHATDWLRLTGGARYTQDHKRFYDADNTALGIVCAAPAACPTAPLLQYTTTLAQQPHVPALGGPPVLVAPGVLVARQDAYPGGQLSTNKVTYRAAIEADVAAHSLLYASVESGYRAGGFNPYNTYNPENITAFTLGSKNRFLNNRLQINAEAFYWKYKDQQLSYFGEDPTGHLGVITANVGRSTIKGVEVEARGAVTPTTTLNANVQYLDAKYDRFSFTSPSPVLSGCAQTSGASGYTVDCSGKSALNSPKWTINLGAEQFIQVGDNRIVFDVDTQYRSGRYTQFDYIPQEYVNHTWVSNASISYDIDHGKYVLQAFIRNIENNRPQIYTTAVPASNLIVSIIAPPRTFGVRASTKF